jgi:aspartate aminotransferase
MDIISERIKGLEESQTIKMAKLGRELAAEGFQVVNLSFGEPDFQTPDHIKLAAKQAIDDGYTHYTPVSGYAELRMAIVEKFKNDLSYGIENIVVSTGAKQSLANALSCLVNLDDEVIIPTPYWVSYSEMVKLAEGKTVYINTTEKTNFKISVAELEAAITPRTKIFMFSSPSNPTGSLYSKAELAALVTVFEKNPQIYIISDEIYEHINYIGHHESIAQFDSIIINGVSKAFAMTGWRLGYMAATKEIAQACDKLQSQVTSGTCSITQRAAMAALSGTMKPTYDMRDAFKYRRDLVYKELQSIPGMYTILPEGAFYFFPEISSFFGKSTGEVKIANSMDLCMFLLHDAHVSTVPGEAFGNDNYIRMSYAAAESELLTACRRIKESLAKLE